MRRVFHLLTRCALVAALVALLTGPAAVANTSTNVAVIGSASVINGGTLPTSSTDMPGITFTSLAPANVNAANLAAYDTVVLNVASPQMGCNVNTLTALAKTDLVAWVNAGHKLIIYDSECTPQNYSWLPFPFTTSNPGAQGANGVAVIVEENTLSSNNPANAAYINIGLVNTQTDAVGDANVMTTYDPNWCVDMTARNVLGISGPTHTYAKTGVDAGLIIYNGLDVDYISSFSGPPASGGDYIRKIYVREILQPFNPSNLPCGITVVGITLTPATATNVAGTTHTVTAKLTDLLGTPKPGIAVTFTILSGPNAGATGVCAPVSCMTDANGQATFTYTGSGGPGTDVIRASFVNGTVTVPSQTVQKVWTQPPNKCPFSQGYWKNHFSLWPAGAVPMTFGGETYTGTELLALLHSPTKGDARLILVTQLIAAKLNIAYGSNPAPVASALTAANAVLAGKGHLPAGASVSPSTADGKIMVQTGYVLDQYNNGHLTTSCTF